MKKKSKIKKKTEKKSSAAIPDFPQITELTAAIQKMADRLGALEQKIELIIQNPASNRSGGFSAEKSLPQVHAQSRPASENGPSQPSVLQSTASVRQQPSPAKPARPLYQIICSDCQKSCEIPFKPTGDRPVYCKECFAARKASRKAQKHAVHPHAPIPHQPAAPRHFSSNRSSGQPPMVVQKRQVKVIPNGVGRVTISEMVPAGNKGPVSGAPKGPRPAFARKKRG